MQASASQVAWTACSTRTSRVPAGERVIIQSKTLTANDPAFAAVTADVLRRLKANKDAANFTTPAEDGGLISADKHSALIDFEVAGDPDTAADRVQPILDSTAAAQAAHSDFVIEEFGGASGNKQLNKVFTDDLKKAGELSIPITLGILLLAFGALVAAGIPLMLGLTAVIATMGLLAIPSKIFPMDDSIGAVVLLIGLAVGVDYTMFYLKREREERAEGKSPEDALQVAAATSGRSVLISGLTVMIAMSGMFLTGDPTFKGFGAATIIVVAVAVLGSLTVLPAMLSWLGDRVEKVHLPFVKRFRPEHGESRFWSAILESSPPAPDPRDPPLGRIPPDAVRRRPAAEDGRARCGHLSGEPLHREDLPQDAGSVPGWRDSGRDRHQGDERALPGDQGSDRTAQLARALDVRMYEPILTDVNKAGTVAVISIPVAGSGTDAKSQKAINELEGLDPPEHARPRALDRGLRGDR